MNRKEFLKILWCKFFKPILLISIVIFSLRFLFRIFTHSGIERLIAGTVIGIIILAVAIHFTNSILVSIIRKIRLKFSDRILLTLSITGKVINYLSTIALGVIIYYSWQEKRISAIVFFSVFLLLQIIEVIKKEKTTHYQVGKKESHL
ncbi:hypothetical protein DMA11_22135 [Marinilabiliaceae bacterium JC017]|nr:hypothetical protein DMA11_22135 [Marinilabiliaceae bacterium JC017]